MEEFIIKNYHKLGLKQCTELFNTTRGKVQTITKKYNLKVDRKYLNEILTNTRVKTGSQCKVDITNFTTNLNKYGTYLLGLIWADGYLSKSDENNISIECVDEDMDHFRKVLDETGKWNYYTRTRGKWKTITKASTNNMELASYLTENDYRNKSYVSPDKILNKIPEELIKYFLLGVIDGDGCFYFNQKQYLRQFSITGTINQDWNWFENLFNKLGITYKVMRIKNSKNGYSTIRVTNKKSINILGNFIYDEKYIGLPRKYQKYLEIVK